MKRTCNGCRALSRGICTLGYEVAPKTVIEHVYTVEWKPLQECPKPKTNGELVKLLMVRHS